MRALVRGDDGRRRCWWGASTPDYVAYHDEEWGRPVRGDDALYERLCLEAFQSGLSWLTILRKRENFRQAFAGFEIARVARFTPNDAQRLLADAGIIRNRLKVDAAIHNANVVRSLRASHGGFAQWLDAHALDAGKPCDKAAWVKLFKKTFKFTGGEITGEFLMSLGILPGAHRADCPAFKRIAKLKPVWMRKA